MIFDIDFYPSISKNILINSINYAREYIDITKEQYQIILACRKTVLENETTWVKSGPVNFDTPMGGDTILHKYRTLWVYIYIYIYIYITYTE